MLIVQLIAPFKRSAFRKASSPARTAAGPASYRIGSHNR